MLLDRTVSERVQNACIPSLRAAHNPEVAGSSPAAATIPSVLTAFERCCKNTRFFMSKASCSGATVHLTIFSSCPAVRLIADIHALTGVHGDVRHGDRQLIRNGNHSDAVVVDGEPLHPYAVNLLSLMNLDALHQLVQHPGRELPGSCVPADSSDKYIRCRSLACGAVNVLLQGFDLGAELLLLPLVLCRHSGKPFVCQLTSYIVLRELLSRVIFNF